MKVAVIGGGLFGCTAAIYAARAGHEVHLFEQREALMQAASGCSIYRLHRGYHYPRSSETGLECRRAEASFREEYGACVVDGGNQFYLVPDDSRNHVTAKTFAEFMDNEGLCFSSVEDSSFCAPCFRVVEPRINLSGLTALVLDKIKTSRVNVHLNAKIPVDIRLQFDRIIVAAYANTNNVLEKLGIYPEEYEFHVVEKPVVLLPNELRDTSVVVVDGPFGCIDPVDDTPLHIVYHVDHTIHSYNVKMYPEVPDELAGLIHRGLIRAPKTTYFRDMVTDLGNYIPAVRWATHIGSMFVLRAVLAHQEATDARPTLVTQMDGQVIKIFSGKLGTAVKAARDVVAAIDGRLECAA